jgi:hypothetical protein
VAQKIQYKRQITDAPMLVRTDDADLITFLSSLGTPSFHSNTAGALWALAATDANAGDVAGSAFLVSAEAFKRADAGRLS